MHGSPLSQRQLVHMVLKRFAAALVGLMAMCFVPAWTLDYWEAWAFLAVLFVPVTFVVTYLLRHDPALLKRRMTMKEREPTQGRVVRIASACMLLAVLLPGFDHRLGWSQVPVGVVALADALVLLGYGLVFLVFRENSFASRVVEVTQGQQVVTTGPYAMVRHPMYVGIIVMYIATPVALGSWWAVIPALPVIPILVARIRNEELVLVEQLSGYRAYMSTTRYRLLPGVW